MQNRLTDIAQQATEQAKPQRRWQFDHHRLDAYEVALQALVRGTQMLDELPQGYGKLKSQGARALQGAFTQTTEASARKGADRRQRYRVARAEAGEAAGVFEAFERLRLISPEQTDQEIELLWRLCAMLYRLSQSSR